MIIILRLSHRLPRDERITTHVGLVARAFGADSMIYSGQRDAGMEESIKKAVEKWGGCFSVEYAENAARKLNELKGNGYRIIHLTMYGKRIEKAKLPNKNIVIVVGGEEVQPEIYSLADYNIAVTSQPHSEVAALAIALNILKKPLSERLERKRFKNAKIRILPSERGKKVINSSSSTRKGH